MAASVALHPAEKPRNRSLEARRAARREKFERERLVVDSLNRGVSVAEIAERIGVTEKRMRALVKDILARRMAAAPEDYAALQASRLNEALLVAMSAMSPENLKAVALVVRIVRELDRYHGFVGADAGARLPHQVGKVAGEARRMGCGKQEGDGEDERGWSCKPAGAEAVGHTPSVAVADSFPGGEGAASAAPTSMRPEMAPQTLEKAKFAPENVALPDAFEAAPLEAENARSAQADDAGVEASDDAVPPAAQSDPPRAGAQTAPQAVENIDSAPGTDSAMAEASPSGEPSPHAGAFASGAASPEETPPPANPIEPQPDDWPDITTVVLAPDPAAPSGFRRMRIRILRNGVAACADAA